MSRVKLTIAAANQILKGIKWRTHSTEYQVMVRTNIEHPANGKVAIAYRIAYAKSRWPNDHSNRIWPQDSYRDALLELERLSDEDRASAVIFRIKTERPA